MLQIINCACVFAGLCETERGSQRSRSYTDHIGSWNCRAQGLHECFRTLVLVWGQVLPKISRESAIHWSSGSYTFPVHHTQVRGPLFRVVWTTFYCCILERHCAGWTETEVDYKWYWHVGAMGQSMTINHSGLSRQSLFSWSLPICRTREAPYCAVNDLAPQIIK